MLILCVYKAAILSNGTVRTALLNFARSVIYTTGPSFPSVACIRAAYNLMRNGETTKVKYLTMTIYSEFPPSCYPASQLMSVAANNVSLVTKQHPASREALFRNHHVEPCVGKGQRDGDSGHPSGRRLGRTRVPDAHCTPLDTAAV